MAKTTRSQDTQSRQKLMMHTLPSAAERPRSAAAAASVRNEVPENETAAAVCCSAGFGLSASQVARVPFPLPGLGDQAGLPLDVAGRAVVPDRGRAVATRSPRCPEDAP